MNFWDSIKSFFANLGHTIMAEIIDALPEAEQLIMQAIQALVDAAIAYVEAKYADQTSLQIANPLDGEEKLEFDNLRHNEAFNYVKSQMTTNGSDYPVVPDSLLHCQIEISYQKALRAKEGNGGNFPGGNSK